VTSIDVKSTSYRHDVHRSIDMTSLTKETKETLKRYIASATDESKSDGSVKKEKNGEYREILSYFGIFQR